MEVSMRQQHRQHRLQRLIEREYNHGNIIALLRAEKQARLLERRQQRRQQRKATTCLSRN